MFLMRNELRDPILPLVFFSVGQTELPEISFLYMMSQFRAML